MDRAKRKNVFGTKNIFCGQIFLTWLEWDVGVPYLKDGPPGAPAIFFHTLMAYGVLQYPRPNKRIIQDNLPVLIDLKVT